jgi:hypothetical protein
LGSHERRQPQGWIADIHHGALPAPCKPRSPGAGPPCSPLPGTPRSGGGPGGAAALPPTTDRPRSAERSLRSGPTAPCASPSEAGGAKAWTDPSDTTSTIHASTAIPRNGWVVSREPVGDERRARARGGRGNPRPGPLPVGPVGEGGVTCVG